MFEPSDEEPLGEGGGERPLSLFAAALWMTAAQLAGLWITWLAVGLREDLAYDPVVLVVCQAAGYLLVLFFMLRLHAPLDRIRDFVAWRSARLAFYPLAVVLGVAAVFPAEWLYERVLELAPRSESAFGLLDVFYQMPFGRRIVVALAYSLLGPAVEELIFRGAAFTTPLARHRPAAVIAVTALFFALIHLDLREMAPFVLMGLMLGYLRYASGSLVPPLLLHASFNATSFVDLLRYDAKPEMTPMPWTWGAAGLAVVLLGLFASRALSTPPAQ